MNEENQLEWRWFSFGMGDASGVWMLVSDGSGSPYDSLGRTYAGDRGEATDGR